MPDILTPARPLAQILGSQQPPVAPGVVTGYQPSTNSGVGPDLEGAHSMGGISVAPREVAVSEDVSPVPPAPTPGSGSVFGGLSWGSVASAAGWLLVKILVIVGIVAVVFTTVFGLVRAPDGSMGPALRAGDVVLVYRVGSDYALGDVVALDYQGHRQLRRVVARAGDRVDITSDGLVVNGAVQDEPHTVGETLRVGGGIDYPLVVGENEVFVLADMREDSGADSRIYGPVKAADTVGKAMSLFRQDRL